MGLKRCLLALTALSIILMLPSLAIQAVFDAEGSNLVDIELPGDFDRVMITLEGLENNGDYPHDVTLDIGDDGDLDWQRRGYHTAIPYQINDIYYMLSDDVSGNDGNVLGRINVYDNWGVSAGYIDLSNEYHDGVRGTGVLAIGSGDAVGSQRISIYGDTGPVDAFIPENENLNGNFYVYVAQGGSTYYCQDDSGYPASECTLTPEAAMQEAYLARRAESITFDFQEIIDSQTIAQELKSYLSSCESPCLVPFRFTSDSAGIINYDVEFLNDTSCDEAWICSSWTACTDSSQSCLSWTDSSSCGTTAEKPVSETRACTITLPPGDKSSDSSGGGGGGGGGSSGGGSSGGATVSFSFPTDHFSGNFSEPAISIEIEFLSMIENLSVSVARIPARSPAGHQAEDAFDIKTNADISRIKRMHVIYSFKRGESISLFQMLGEQLIEITSVKIADAEDRSSYRAEVPGPGAYVLAVRSAGESSLDEVRQKTPGQGSQSMPPNQEGLPPATKAFNPALIIAVAVILVLIIAFIVWRKH